MGNRRRPVTTSKIRGVIFVTVPFRLCTAEEGNKNDNIEMDTLKQEKLLLQLQRDHFKEKCIRLELMLKSRQLHPTTKEHRHGDVKASGDKKKKKMAVPPSFRSMVASGFKASTTVVQGKERLGAPSHFNHNDSFLSMNAFPSRTANGNKIRRNR